MMHHDKEQGHLTLTPKMSFILGLAGGVMMLCSIGFFITLSILIKGGAPKSDSLLADNKPSQVAPTAPLPSNQPEEEDTIGPIAPISEDDHVWGNSTAKVTLYEWSDFECPFCSRFLDTVNQIKKEYGKDKVRIVFRHFPLSFHANARPAALASECAGEQGKFWEYHDLLFANNTSLSASTYEKLAKDVGLNVTKFKACLDDQKYLSKINDDMSAGSTAGITGTPGTIIVAADGSTQLIPGALPFAQVKPMIDAAL